MVIIELLELDAEKFKLFQKYYDNFAILLDKGFFEIKTGSGKVHFDASGSIRKVEVSTMINEKK